MMGRLFTWLVIGMIALAPVEAALAQSPPAKPTATSAAKPTPAAATPAGAKPVAPGTKSAQPSPAAAKPVESKPAPAKAPEMARARKKVQPVLMELSSTKTVYRAWDDIIVSAELWAIQPTTICVYPQHPEINFTVNLYRGGFGQVDIPPTVVHLDQQTMQTVEKVQLQPGQMYRILFNLKKVANMPPNFWKTGEYRVQSKFYLCNPDHPDEDTAISSSGPLHLLILD